MSGPGTLSAARPPVASAAHIHRQEFAWGSPSAWGNSNGEQRKVFYNPARGNRRGQ